MRVFLLLLIANCALPILSHAQLHWDQTEQSAVFKPGENRIIREYAFRNSGKTPVKILAVETSCQCTVGKLDKKEYAPGEKGTLKVQFTPTNDTGEQEKNIVVKTDAPNDSISWLSLRVTVPPLATFSPEKASWAMGEKPVEKTVIVTFSESIHATIRDAKCSSTFFTISVKELKKGSQYELRVRPRSTAAPLTAAIRLETDFPQDNPRVLLLTAEIE